MSASRSVLRAPVRAAAAIFTDRGDGHCVLVVPGWGANDVSTVPMRAYLRTRGYDVHGWGLGFHTAGSAATHTAAGGRLRELAEASAGPVSIVGWSLGGVLACTLGRRHPDLVRQIITLGSPYHHPPRQVPVPLTSIYSRQDRIVPWRRSRITETEIHHNIEVYGGHLGLGTNPAVLHAVDDRLANIESGPFAPTPLWRAAYRNADRT